MTLIKRLISFYNLNHIDILGIIICNTFHYFSTNIFLLGKIVFNLILALAFNIIIVVR